MYISRQNSKSKNLSNNMIKSVVPKTIQLLSTNNKKTQNNKNSFITFSLLKSKSIAPSTSNTSRNQKFNNLKKSFENLFNNQVSSLRNSTSKNKSLMNSLLRPKSKSKPKTKSKQKCGISSKNHKICNLKESSSYLSNSDFIKNILLLRKKNKNKNNVIINMKNRNNKTQNNHYNNKYILNNSKSRSNSIRCSLTYVNRYSYIAKPDRMKIKYNNNYTKCIYINTNKKYNKCYNYNNTINDIIKKDNNKNINKDKWPELLLKLENLKIKTNFLLNKYYSLSENLYNELEILNQNCPRNILVNNKSYDFRKKYLIYNNKNDEEKLINEFMSGRYVNTDINNYQY
jgi:hypothetical protein